MFNEIRMMNIKLREMGITDVSENRQHEKEQVLKDLHALVRLVKSNDKAAADKINGLKFTIGNNRITSYNVCYTKLLRLNEQRSHTE